MAVISSTIVEASLLQNRSGEIANKSSEENTSHQNIADHIHIPDSTDVNKLSDAFVGSVDLPCLLFLC